MVRRVFALVFLTVLATGPVGGPDGVAARWYEVTVGDRVRVTERSTTKTVNTAVVKGEKKEQVETVAEVVVYVEEVLARPDAGRPPTKLRRAYETAERIKDGKRERLPLHGKRVQINRTGDTFDFSFADGAAMPQDVAAELSTSFTGVAARLAARDWVPAGPLTPRKPWPLDRAAIGRGLAAATEFEIDAARVFGSGTLLRSYDRDGRRYGVFEFVLDFPVSGLKGEDQVKAKPGSVVLMKATRDVCIDGSDPGGTSTYGMTAVIDATAPGTELRQKADTTWTTTVERVVGK